MNNPRKILGWTAFIVSLLLFLDAYIFEKLFFKVKKFKLGNEAGNKKPLRLVHISDLHFKTSFPLQHRLLVRTINNLQPDLILLSGDSIDQHGSLEPFDKFLQNIDPNIKVYAVPGNHEYAANISISEMAGLMDKHNARLLINETAYFSIDGTRIAITGVDDLMEGDENFDKAVEDVGNENNHFVLLHNPLHHEKILKRIQKLNNLRSKEQQLNIVLFLAGHTHGGQVTLGSVVPHLPPLSGGYVKGWYHEKPPYLYLSKGFGTSTLPLRFFARAEITSISYFPEPCKSLT